MPGRSQNGCLAGRDLEWHQMNKTRTTRQFTESELYPLGDLQLKQVVEKRSDVIRPSRRENQPSCTFRTDWSLLRR